MKFSSGRNRGGLPRLGLWVAITRALARALKPGPCTYHRDFSHLTGDSLARRHFPLRSGAWMLCLTLSLAALACDRAHALVIGEPALLSAIGQPLRLRITVKAQEGDLLEIASAPRDHYERSGIPWLPALASLGPVERISATDSLILGTTESVYEPWLPVILRFRTGAGVFTRRFDLLIDPAVTGSSTPAQPAPDPKVEKSAEPARSRDSAQLVLKMTTVLSFRVGSAPAQDESAAKRIASAVPPVNTGGKSIARTAPAAPETPLPRDRTPATVPATILARETTVNRDSPTGLLAGANTVNAEPVPLLDAIQQAEAKLRSLRARLDSLAAERDRTLARTGASAARERHRPETGQPDRSPRRRSGVPVAAGRHPGDGSEKEFPESPVLLSGIGQPLRLRIPFGYHRQGMPEITGAPRDEYERNGIPWSPALATLGTIYPALEDGSVIVGTTEPVFEPWLPVILKFRSASEDKSRKMDLLLNPPGAVPVASSDKGIMRAGETMSDAVEDVIGTLAKTGEEPARVASVRHEHPLAGGLSTLHTQSVDRSPDTNAARADSRASRKWSATMDALLREIAETESEVLSLRELIEAATAKQPDPPAQSSVMPPDTKEAFSVAAGPAEHPAGIPDRQTRPRTWIGPRELVVVALGCLALLVIAAGTLFRFRMPAFSRGASQIDLARQSASLLARLRRLIGRPDDRKRRAQASAAQPDQTVQTGKTPHVASASISTANQAKPADSLDFS